MGSGSFFHWVWTWLSFTIVLEYFGTELMKQFENYHKGETVTAERLRETSR